MSHHNDTVSRAVTTPGGQTTANEHHNSPTPTRAQAESFDLLHALVNLMRVAEHARDSERFAILGATLLQEAHLLLIGHPGANKFAPLLTRFIGQIHPGDADLQAELRRTVAAETQR
ncbi:hypothetical protein D3248_01610 [Leucobacter zeae]|nr:hypothetical protein [Leucobacter zeae]